MKKSQLAKLYGASLTSLGYKMYFYFCLTYSADVWHMITYRELAQHFKVHKSQAKLAINVMVDAGLLKKRERKNTYCEYLIITKL